ncbi:MAG: MerR family transcriptional regulator [Oscillospiraceae bacterium]|nr:MerR family transcriptional regulator [Oscillospiraceae bacterium]
MKLNITFSIKEFAEFSRTTRDTLRHYDKIGLLSPAIRGENKYRYYNNAQLSVVNVIRTLQESGMTLDEIKKFIDTRTPELTDEVFSRQVKKIDEIIEEWINAKKLLQTLRKTIRSAKDVDENKVSIEFVPAEAIILGDINDYSRNRNVIDALLSFYKKTREEYPDLSLNYSVWGKYSEKRIKQADWVWPDRFYFYNPEGHDRKPAAMYAIGYKRGGYGQSDDLYKRIIEYIDKNGFEICGDAYEEYPLNEVCMTDDKNYLMRVMITVREKGGRETSRSDYGKRNAERRVRSDLRRLR